MQRAPTRCQTRKRAGRGLRIATPACGLVRNDNIFSGSAHCAPPAIFCRGGGSAPPVFGACSAGAAPMCAAADTAPQPDGEAHGPRPTGFSQGTMPASSRLIMRRNSCYAFVGRGRTPPLRRFVNFSAAPYMPFIQTNSPDRAGRRGRSGEAGGCSPPPEHPQWPFYG